MKNDIRAEHVSSTMGVKRSIVDGAIVIFSLVGMALILFTEARVWNYVGAAVLLFAVILSFNRGIGYAILKWLGR
jgi:hypothetical protein